MGMLDRLLNNKLYVLFCVLWLYEVVFWCSFSDLPGMIFDLCVAMTFCALFTVHGAGVIKKTKMFIGCSVAAFVLQMFYSSVGIVRCLFWLFKQGRLCDNNGIWVICIIVNQITLPIHIIVVYISYLLLMRTIETLTAVPPSVDVDTHPCATDDIVVI